MSQNCAMDKGMPHASFRPNSEASETNSCLAGAATSTQAPPDSALDPSENDDDTSSSDGNNFVAGSWRAPRHALAPLPATLGQVLPWVPAWYNDVTSGCTSLAVTQIGTTCGLFAVNHALSSSALLGISQSQLLSAYAFEVNALAARIGDTDDNLIEPGGANYDWAALHANLELACLNCHPVDPAVLQDRLGMPFADHLFDNRLFRAAAYVLQTPQCRGHWITLLPIAVLNEAFDSDAASLLCDSLCPAPVVLSQAETENLLLACALEGVSVQNVNGNNMRWASFLITGSAFKNPGSPSSQEVSPSVEAPAEVAPRPPVQVAQPSEQSASSGAPSAMISQAAQPAAPPVTRLEKASSAPATRLSRPERKRKAAEPPKTSVDEVHVQLITYRFDSCPSILEILLCQLWKPVVIRIGFLCLLHLSNHTGFRNSLASVLLA